MEVGFPDGAVVKNLPANTEDARGFEPWIGKIPWRRKWNNGWNFSNLIEL